MISTIITTYKREPGIVIRAIKSILSQTYSMIEIIVVDDSPNDYSQRNDVKNAVLSFCDNDKKIPVIYIAHEKNMGACEARNTGIKTSKGEYIAFLDDDDEWLPTKLEKQLSVIEKSGAALVYCGSINIHDGTGKREEEKRSYFRGKVFDKLLFSNFIESTSYPLIRKKCIVEIGGFDPLMQSAQDYDVWLRLAKKYDVDYVEEPLVLYHEHDGERITNNSVKKINGLERINLKNQRFIALDRKLWWRRHIVITQFYAINGDFGQAIKLWIKCVCKCPEKIKENLQYMIYIIKAGNNDYKQ